MSGSRGKIPTGGGAGRRRGGFTLSELCVVVTLIGVLAAMAAPRFGKAIEQARADTAVANLQSVWAAERCYWISRHEYAASLSALDDERLIDRLLAHPELLSDSPWYRYEVVTSGPSAFTARAILQRGARAGDYLEIDQTGAIGGAIHGSDGSVLAGSP